VKPTSSDCAPLRVKCRAHKALARPPTIPNPLFAENTMSATPPVPHPDPNFGGLLIVVRFSYEDDVPNFTSNARTIRSTQFIRHRMKTMTFTLVPHCSSCVPLSHIELLLLIADLVQ
jgi:hypothetical protein